MLALVRFSVILKVIIGLALAVVFYTAFSGTLNEALSAVLHSKVWGLVGLVSLAILTKIITEG